MTAADAALQVTSPSTDPVWFDVHGATADVWLFRRPQTVNELAAHFPVFDLDELVSVATQVSATRKLLEVGCGPGRRAFALHAAGFDVTGIDIDPEAVSVCTQRAAKVDSAPNFQVADIAEFSADPVFDVVFALDFVVNYCDPSEDGRAATRDRLAGLSRCCRPGGVIVIDWLNPFVFWPEVRLSAPYLPIRIGSEDAVLRIRHERPAFSSHPQTLDLVSTYRLVYGDGTALEFLVHQPYVWYSANEICEIVDAVGLKLLTADLDLDDPIWRVFLTS